MNLCYHIKHPFDSVKRVIQYVIWKHRYKEYHLGCTVVSSWIITPKYISLGKSVFIGPYARVEGVCKYNKTTFTPHIILHDNVRIQQNVHITCANKIEIGKNTAIAAGVTITDINHPYTDIDIPVEKQDIEVKDVLIGEDCKIYNGAAILPGVHIGKHCVVGANSVVTKNIPDYSVAVGSPAKVIKQYNFETQQWEKV